MNNSISIDGEILSGEPVFTGTRVPVKALFDYLEDGYSITEFMDDYPSVNNSMIIKVLEMASERVCVA